jgi:hypothetical protein
MKVPHVLCLWFHGLEARGHKEMSSILADHWRPKCGGEEEVAGPQPMSTAVHMEPKLTLEI